MKMRIGWEFECCVEQSADEDIIRIFREFFPRTQRGGDSSIDLPDECDDYNDDDLYDEDGHYVGSQSPLPQYEAYEFRTQPFEWNDGLSRLDGFLSAIYPYSKSELFVTNESCGWHTNVSLDEVHSDIANSNVFRRENFYRLVCANFDHARAARRYGRVNNDYCDTNSGIFQDYQTIKGLKLGKLIELSPKHTGYGNGGNVIYLPMCKYNPVGFHQNRIEFRVPGNANYERKHDSCARTLNDIKAAFTAAYDGLVEYEGRNQVRQPMAA